MQLRNRRSRGRVAIALLGLVLAASCSEQDGATHAGVSAASYPSAASTRTTVGRLRMQGTFFTAPGGTPFHWRGITAFRLLEMIARGREADAVAFLDWAAGQKLTVLRVVVMAHHLFKLTPDDGRAALPRLLTLAADRDLYVEIVALADTASIPVDLDEHVKAVGAIAARHPNALVEIANEPIHPTQAPRLHDPAEVTRLAGLVPDPVPVALGSAEGDDRFSAGDYATFHFPRDSGRGGWGHVLALAEGAAFIGRWKKPVVNDEPMGAGAEHVPGRRDNEPARFRAAALMSRLVGMGATFHYEGGLQAKIPVGRELDAFNAWNEAWTLLPGDVERDGTFRHAVESGAAVRSFDSKAVLAVVERQRGDRAWVLVVNPGADPSLEWQAGWSASDVRRLDRVWLITARKSG